ncbi:MAG: DNA repair protein RecO [Acidimicrobiia bacterium]|nr:DNA repair protein RecO [Acidimicrobiia bacterium]
MSLYREHGIVLRTWRLGEADRIVSVLTRHHGKVRAVAKGARKTRSRFAARLQPSRHLSLQLFAGRGDLDTVTQAETVDGFTAIASDLGRLGRASVMLEVTEHVSLDREPNVALYQLLLGALRTLEAADRPLVLTGFLLKLLTQEGVQPALDGCVSCGEREDLVTYDTASGGVRCRRCRAGLVLADGSLEVMRHIVAGRLRSVLDEAESPATRGAEQVAVMATERFLERRLRAPGVASEAGLAPSRASGQPAREIGPQAPVL